MLPSALQREPVTLSSAWFDDVWTALDDCPPKQDYLVLGGGRSRFTLIAMSWDEVDWQDFLRGTPTSAPLYPGNGWTTGHLAIHCYDAKEPDSKALPRVFRLLQTLVIDHQQRRAEICWESAWEKCLGQWSLPKAAAQRGPVQDPLPTWQSNWSDDQYRQAVSEIREDIRRGRFYQMNLLRYWQTHDPITRSQWFQQLTRMGGPFSAYIHIPGLQLVSFSPERFFKLATEADETWVETEPIKGTRAVSSDPAENLRQQQLLMMSRKDEAELNMIVDLLRNDLLRICEAASVKVLDPGSLHSFANVHHRIARIRGSLRPNLPMATVLAALCPGGSITGAPKREVMRAIQEKEARSRGYFMGNIMYRDSFTGRLDSSILIRTALSQEPGLWEFAAGSGLVIHSDPDEELLEIMTKAKVLFGSFSSR